MAQTKSIVKKDNLTTEGTTGQLLGLAGSLCGNLPQAIGASNETASACMAAKMGEISVIQQRMASAELDELPALIEQHEAAYKALNRKDIQNKLYGFAITTVVCGAVTCIVKYVYKAAKSVV